MEASNEQIFLVKKYQSGFTVLELIAIIVITVILMKFAVSRWAGGPNVNAQAQQLAANIRYTQSLAMTHAQRYRLTITVPNTYAIATISGTAVPDMITRNNTTTLNSGIQFGALTNLPNNLIAFDGRGIPYTNASATTALTSTAIINLTDGDTTRQVQINPNGQVTVQ